MGNLTDSVEKYWQMEVTLKASGKMDGDMGRVKK